jgi:hypothetical protein
VRRAECAGLQKAIHEIEDVVLSDVCSERLAEHSPVQRVEKIFDIGLNDLSVPLLQAVEDDLGGLLRRASRSKAITTGTKGRFKAGLEDIEDGVLHHTISHGGNPNVTPLPVALAQCHVA